jgi:hypothetical protein
MQILWSKILAGEANSPGSFSKLTLKIISELEKKDAEFFTTIGSCIFFIDQPEIIIFFNDNDMAYEKNNITFVKLTHLETLGLIRFDTLSGFIKRRLPKRFQILYFNIPITLEMQNDNNNQLEIGNILLTQTGRELINICGAMPNAELRQLILNKWKKDGVIIH